MNFAVVGLGWVATHRHLPCLRLQKDAQLYGVIDRNAERVRKVVAGYPGIKTAVNDRGEAEWIRDVDAVVISTSPQSHYSLAEKFLRDGKHVLVEKPLTMPDEDGNALVELAEKQGKIFSVVHNFQFARSILKAKELFRRGDLGEIIGVEAVQWSNPNRRLPLWYEDLPMGLFWDESPHLLYLIDSLFTNAPEFLDARVIPAQDRKTPLSVTSFYSCRDVPIRVSMNFNSAISEWYLCVMGSKKMIAADIFRDILMTIPNDRQHRARDILTTTGFAVSDHLWGTLTSGLRLAFKRLYYGNDVLYQRFLDSIRAGQPFPGISGRDGVRIVNMQKQILACRN